MEALVLKKMLMKLFSMETPQKAMPTTGACNKEINQLDYFKSEISSSTYFKEDSWTVVLQHFTHEKRLTDGTPLLAEEKRSLGLNSRMTVTREMIDVLTPSGLAYGPKKAFETTYCKATHAYSRTQSVEKMRHAGFTHFSPLASGDQRDCSWCLSVSKKLMPIDTDFELQIRHHCTCTYCRCVLLARRSS
jgi:hypothetical protein